MPALRSAKRVGGIPFACVGLIANARKPIDEVPICTTNDLPPHPTERSKLTKAITFTQAGADLLPLPPRRERYPQPKYYALHCCCSELHIKEGLKPKQISRFARQRLRPHAKRNSTALTEECTKC
jgi:hypothetical protein